MPLLETAIATVAIAAAGARLTRALVGARDARQRRHHRDTARALDAAFLTLGGQPRKIIPDLEDVDARYDFDPGAHVAAAHGAFTLTRVDGSQAQVTLEVTRAPGTGLPHDLSLHQSHALVTGIGSARSRVRLPEDVEVSGGTLELLGVMLPETRAALERLEGTLHARIDRFEIGDRVVTLCVTLERRSRRAPLGDSAASTLEQMWTVCAGVSYTRPALAVLRDAVLESAPGSELRTSALRQMVDRSPRAPSTRTAWATVVEERHYLDLLVCHAIAPARLERDLDHAALVELLQLLSHRPRPEQEALASLFVRRLGPDVFYMESVSPHAALVLFASAFDEDLLARDDLEAAFSAIVGTTSLEHDLDAACGFVAQRAWARGARTVCMALTELSGKTSDGALLDMIDAIARVDVSSAREYEIESALLRVIARKKTPRFLDLARAMGLLALVGGGRSIETLRAQNSFTIMSHSESARALQIAQDIEDRLGGVISRGGLSVMGDAGAAGGLSQARGEAGGLEVTDD